MESTSLPLSYRKRISEEEVRAGGEGGREGRLVGRGGREGGGGVGDIERHEEKEGMELNSW